MPLSLFPPPGPSLPPFSALLTKGSYHPTALFHLALGHVLESVQNEVLILSPSRPRLEEKLVLDGWFSSSATTNKLRAAMSRIVIIYPPSPVHFSLVIATLDGTQSASELISLWSGLANPPTENLSMIILDDISTYFTDTNQAQPELSMMSLVSRLMQSANRISTARGETKYGNVSYSERHRVNMRSSISIACFESALFNSESINEPSSSRSLHLGDAISGLFQCVVQVEDMDATLVNIPTPRREVPEHSNEMVQLRKRLCMTTKQVDGSSDQAYFQYTEILEPRSDNSSVLRFSWK